MRKILDAIATLGGGEARDYLSFVAETHDDEEIRTMAAEALELAAAKTAQYEAALRAARSEVYQAQEQAHRQLAEHHDGELLAARQHTEQLVREAERQLAQDAEILKQELAAASDALANQIADSILRGRAA